MASFFFRCLPYCLLSFCDWSREIAAASLSSHDRHHWASLELGRDDVDHTDAESSSDSKLQEMMQKLRHAYPSYDKHIRPLPDSSEFDGSHRIKVLLGLRLVKMLEIHQIQQTFSIAVWLRRMWPDYRLKYNAAEYFRGTSLLSNGSWDSKSMSVPIEQETVWTPEIQVLNSVAAPEQIWKPEQQPRVLWYDENKLKTDGYNMVLVTPEVLTVSCSMRLEDFPFVTQLCKIQFGGWTASEKYFDIGAVQMEESSTFTDADSEFDITPLHPVRKSFHDEYLAGDQPVPSVEYPIRFSRKPHFYMLTVVLPMFLLVLLGQALYWMDMRKERLSTGITVVLAVMAVNFLVEPLLPKTREVLWIEKFQVGCYVLTCLPLFLSILLDHCVLKKLCTKNQGEEADRLARIVHPIVVLLFYFMTFGVPGFRYLGGNTSFWPYSVPEIMLFLSFNACIFSLFLGSACMELPFLRKHLPNVPDDDESDASKDPSFILA